jgi:copper homeostasis protein
LLEGGVTPSAGVIELVRSKISAGLRCFYSLEEFETMRRDVMVAKKLGADGVVLGILEAHGNVDIARSRELVELARPLNVTRHRAFDMSADLFRSLDDICATGADRLTSGGEQTAWQGVDRISQLVKAARARIVIMAGGGIDDNNAVNIIEHTGVREIHVGLGSSSESPMLHRSLRISMGTALRREYQRSQVAEEDVMNLRRAVTLARS